MKKFFDQLFKIQSADLDDYRRRRLVSILLFGIIVLAVTLLGMVAIFFLVDDTDFSGSSAVLLGLVSTGVFLVFAGGIFWLNRIRSGTLAAWIFLLLLLLTLSFADDPYQVVHGRSLYLFTLPILMSSFILFPWASFVFAAFSSLSLWLLTVLGNLGIPNFFGMLGFFAIAFVAWLASNGMEKALKDLRILNRELDQRVEERTRELAEALVRESAEAGKNQAILEGIADGVVVFDADGQMIVANPSVCRLLDTSRKVLLGKTINEFVTLGQLPDSETKKLHEMLADPEGDSLSARVIWGEKTLSITTAAVITQLGKSIGTVAVVRDFTREAEIERMKNTFVAMVSHELRTPLNAVLAYSEMIQGGVYGPVNAEQEKAAGRIFTNTQRLIGLVSDLLDEARLEAGKMKIDVAEFSIIEVIDSMRGVMEKPAKDKGLALNIIVSGTTPKKIWGDSNRYQQIIINLVNNAVKFTKSGKVLVKVTGVDENQWQLEVSDTGPGIPEDALPHIFDTFRQVDGLATRQHGGAGLGLSIVKRLVDIMGGAINVTSVVGVGTTFTLLFPVQAQENQ
jgi:PAS domain S-box-containing protein